jgi:hypothetical protein
VLGSGWVGKSEAGSLFRWVEELKWDVDWAGSGADVICDPRVELYTCLRVLMDDYSTDRHWVILVHLRS